MAVCPHSSPRSAGDERLEPASHLPLGLERPACPLRSPSQDLRTYFWGSDGRKRVMEPRVWGRCNRCPRQVGSLRGPYPSVDFGAGAQILVLLPASRTRGVSQDASNTSHASQLRQLKRGGRYGS